MSKQEYPLRPLSSLTRTNKLKFELPADTPTWIVLEFERFPELWERWELHQVLNSRFMTRRMWRTIERLEQMRVSEAQGGFAQTSRIRPFAIFIRRGLAGFNRKEARMTPAKRLKRSQQIVKQAAKLRKILSAMSDHDDFFEWSMHFGSFPSEQLISLLGELEEAAPKWAEPMVPIARPNEKNTARLYFMRTVSIGFQHRYGKPLPTITHALVSIFFGEDEALDVSGVSRRLKTFKRRR